MAEDELIEPASWYVYGDPNRPGWWLARYQQYTRTVQVRPSPGTPAREIPIELPPLHLADWQRTAAVFLDQVRAEAGVAGTPMPTQPQPYMLAHNQHRAYLLGRDGTAHHYLTGRLGWTPAGQENAALVTRDLEAFAPYARAAMEISAETRILPQTLEVPEVLGDQPRGLAQDLAAQVAPQLAQLERLAADTRLAGPWEETGPRQANQVLAAWEVLEISDRLEALALEISAATSNRLPPPVYRETEADQTLWPGETRRLGQRLADVLAHGGPIAAELGAAAVAGDIQELTRSAGELRDLAALLRVRTHAAIAGTDPAVLTAAEQQARWARHQAADPGLTAGRASYLYAPPDRPQDWIVRYDAQAHRAFYRPDPNLPPVEIPGAIETYEQFVDLVRRHVPALDATLGAAALMAAIEADQQQLLIDATGALRHHVEQSWQPRPGDPALDVTATPLAQLARDVASLLAETAQRASVPAERVAYLYMDSTAGPVRCYTDQPTLLHTATQTVALDDNVTGLRGFADVLGRSWPGALPLAAAPRSYWMEYQDADGRQVACNGLALYGRADAEQHWRPVGTPQDVAEIDPAEPATFAEVARRSIQTSLASADATAAQAWGGMQYTRLTDTELTARHQATITEAERLAGRAAATGDTGLAARAEAARRSAAGMAAELHVRGSTQTHQQRHDADQQRVAARAEHTRPQMDPGTAANAGQQLAVAHTR